MLTKTELSKIDRQTWSGHAHTEFCSHGSGEPVEDYIDAAIAAGFKTYSITEHFPMPPKFFEEVSGSRHAIYTAAMNERELDAYLEKMALIKMRYADRIRVLVGFEIDYFPRYQDWTAAMLERYGQRIDDAILSVHFLPTATGLRTVDDSEFDFRDGVLAEYGSPVEVANAYLSTVIEAVRWDAPNKPGRYGHITLYRKWLQQFSEETVWKNDTTTQLVNQLLDGIAKRGEMLDCNMSGLPRVTQQEPSPTFAIIDEALKREIPMVYGSDTHSVADVAQGYQTYVEKQLYR
ncbi:Histidinol-phosphatase [Furfurilactobacillus rossiae]|uniref:histidinol-phosphatase HisJ n=1 Tax=Furfurilactobacillus rossiae TaxID=231049 RepID=UPI0015BA4A7A|nr:histidinol-phosphatase HisJ [Furfurilactobacillus rossiae]MCF6165760.1 histidinol-phosphatase HisJ [Furfurilactobacillus rossiae]QLE63116.1 Histidinol-phosphatase [Furfurilactobacillus rossiae]